MTTIPVASQTQQQRNWQTCACCGRRIRLLEDQQSLLLFLAEKTLQRRAFQCINCKTVICRECRENGATCVCRSNAWLARPYLDLSMQYAALNENQANRSGQSDGFKKISEIR